MTIGTQAMQAGRVSLPTVTAHAIGLLHAGDLAAARTALSAALAAADTDHLHRDVAAAATVYARVLTETGEYAMARDWARYAHTCHQRLYGADNPQSIAAAGTLVTALRRAGDWHAAARELSGIVAALTRTAGPADRRTLCARADLAIAEHRCGRCGTALHALVATYQQYRQLYGYADPTAVRMLAHLGRMYRDCGHHQHATTCLHHACATAHRCLGPAHPLTAQIHTLMARKPDSHHATVCDQRQATAGQPYEQHASSVAARR